MARIINQRELRNDNAAIMRAVEKGESFIVTRNGTPVADLVPRQTAKRQAVPVSELLSALAGGLASMSMSSTPISTATWTLTRCAVPVSRIVGLGDPRPA